MKNIIFKKVLWILPLVSIANALTFSINAEADPVFVVSDKFISFTLDSSNIENKFADFNLTSTRLMKLMSYLSPAYFRIGGTTADSVIFSADGSSTSDVVLTGSDWLQLYEFSKSAGVRLLFDLNSLQRQGDGHWNSINGESLIDFSAQNGLELDWELGNEPDLYDALFHTHVYAKNLGEDYETLRAILNKYDLYKSSKLVGPDMFDVGGSSSSEQYLATFLANASDVVDAVTWHQYYFAGDVATEAMFLDPNTFNYLEQRINVLKSIVKNNKIWLGETSSAYKKGAPKMSDRYLATFLWLDKLGLGAKMGLEVIIRQTFHGYNYALVSNNSDPNPDWWVSVFYNNVVGPTVVSTTSDASASSKVRLYAQCAKTMENVWGNSSVVVFGLNIDSTNGSFTLEGFNSDDKVYFFEFTSESTLTSQLIRLNGNILELTPDAELPLVDPQIIEKTQTYNMAPYSLGFWVFTNTNVKACTS